MVCSTQVRTREGSGDVQIPANKVQLLLSEPGTFVQLRLEDVEAAVKAAPELVLDDETDPLQDARQRPSLLVRADRSVVGTLLGSSPYVLAGQNLYNANLFFGVARKGCEPITMGCKVFCAAVESDNAFVALVVQSHDGKQSRNTIILYDQKKNALQHVGLVHAHALAPRCA